MRSPSYLLAALLLAFPTAVLAQAHPQTASLAKTVRKGALPASRITAAGLLGDSDDPEALAPLCDALGDDSGEVRAAAARALGKLGEPGGVGCLEARQAEADEAVKAAQASALASLQALQARHPKVYVKLGEVKDATGSLSPELMKYAEARLRRRLLQVGAALAPEKEAEAEARAVLKKQKWVGYWLQPTIQAGPPGGLKVVVMVVSYPGKQKLTGNATVQAADADPEELLAALLPQAIDEAVATFKTK